MGTIPGGMEMYKMITAVSVCVTWGLAWALFLQFTDVGRYLAQHETWITVVVGNGAVLGIALLVLPWQTVETLFWLFAAAGLPIIGRALINNARAAHERWTELRGGDGD